MRLLHLLEDNTMKIDEVQIQEAEPNYETDPAQARLSAIAVKLMDKAETVTDENLQIALSRVAQHLPTMDLLLVLRTCRNYWIL